MKYLMGRGEGEPGFAFNLGDDVTMTHSGEGGEVIGRAEYSNAENSYHVRYLAGDGRQVEQWWSESALVATEVEADEA